MKKKYNSKRMSDIWSDIEKMIDKIPKTIVGSPEDKLEWYKKKEYECAFIE